MDAEHHTTPPADQSPLSTTPDGPENTGERPASAIGHFPSHLRLWIVAAVTLGLDLWSKHWAFTCIDPNPSLERPYDAVRGLVTFRRSLNPGALFGLGKGLTPVFIGASLLALGFVLFLFWQSSPKRRSLHIALGLVLAGALGNMYDRAYMIADVVKSNHNGRHITLIGKLDSPDSNHMTLRTWPEKRYMLLSHVPADADIRQQGVVRDFIKLEPCLHLRGYRIDLWPWIFNVADMLLVIGVSILMLNFWWERKAERACAASVPPAADSTGGNPPA